jgi:hypothetical protein
MFWILLVATVGLVPAIITPDAHANDGVHRQVKDSGPDSPICKICKIPGRRCTAGREMDKITLNLVHTHRTG